MTNQMSGPSRWLIRIHVSGLTETEYTIVVRYFSIGVFLRHPVISQYVVFLRQCLLFCASLTSPDRACIHP